MKHSVKRFGSLFILFLMIFISCNEYETDGVIPEKMGRVRVQLTDSPFPVRLISSAVVTIDKVEIKKQSESESLKDSFIVISEEVMEINLLELTNGITTLIASANLDPGYYSMIRLHVVEANIETTDGFIFNLKIPSGYSSGMKILIKPAIHIVEGETTDVLLDFDIHRSFVVKGFHENKILGFNFKPVVRGICLGHAGRIIGTVTDTSGVKLEYALVKLWNPEDEDDTDEDEYLHAATFTDPFGNYKLVGLPAGSYSLICSKDGFVSDTIRNVPVSAGLGTTVDFKLVPN